jgi:uncharacterized membrane protein
VCERKTVASFEKMGVVVLLRSVNFARYKLACTPEVGGVCTSVARFLGYTEEDFVVSSIIKKTPATAPLTIPKAITFCLG